MARWLLAALKKEPRSPDLIHIGSESEITVSGLAGLVAALASDITGKNLRVEFEGGLDLLDGRFRYLPQTFVTRTYLGTSQTVNLESSIHRMLSAAIVPKEKPS
jgi:hypothetical protein